ncbi:MAG: TonB-dependent receptor [Bacteroidota bacterium]
MKYLILFSLVFIYSTYNAQGSYKISGRIIDAQSNEAISFASIGLFNSADSVLIKGTVSDSMGHFKFDEIEGLYFIKVEFLGYSAYQIEEFSLSQNISLPEIRLKSSSELLETIEIKGEKSSVEYHMDKRIFNVGKDLTSKGGNATDILGNVPSVNVTASGEISLRGNSGVRILINGKASVLTQNGGLETIPSENIERVEVITNPSAKYDAEGTAGIINIVLKKNKKMGYSSSLQLSGGIPDDNVINYNANLKGDRINFFSNFRYGKHRYEGYGVSERIDFNNNEIVSVLNQNVIRERSRKVLTIYGGGDYYIDSLNTLTLSYYHRNNLSQNSIEYAFTESDSLNMVFSSALENYREPQIASQIELVYEKNFAKKGKNFRLNMQYDFWNDDENERVESHSDIFNEGRSFELRSRDIESSDDFIIQSDLSLPLLNNQLIELGVKGEFRRIDSDYSVWEDEELVDSLNNILQYYESIVGTYLQFGNRVNKWNYQFGLRGEYSYTHSRDLKDEFITDKKYFQIFPSASLNYALSEAAQLQLSYSRRIRRPRFWQLNPFGGIADLRNRRIGNPDLNPMYSNIIEFGSNFSKGKLSFNPVVYAMTSNNIFQNEVNRVEDLLLTKSVNAGREEAIGFELNTSYSATKSIRLRHELNVYAYRQSGLFTISDQSLFSRLNANFRSKNSSIQVSMNFQQGGRNGQFEIKDQYWMNIAANHDFLGERASVSFNVRNVLDSRNNLESIFGEDYRLESENVWAGRRFRVNVTYRLNRNRNHRDRLPD